MKVSTLGCSASVLALAWCGAASAQTPAAAPPDASANTTALPRSAAPGIPDNAGGSASSPSGTVPEVVVTAERRATNLQDTPISAQVLSGVDLRKQGVNDVVDLQFATPSVTLQNFGQGYDFNIRGIGKGETNSIVGVGVVTYRDGVATFPGYFQEEPYYDIANLEILRGPQGTFIGQNAIGGAVFITEAPPNFSGFHGDLQAQSGNYNDVELRGAVNIPISDTLAARIAFNDEYRSSYYDVTGPTNGSTGSLKEYSIRGKVLWKPTPQTDVLFTADLGYFDVGGYPSSPATSKADPLLISSNTTNLGQDKFGRFIADASYTFKNGVKLRSISGYQEGRTAAKFDLDATDVASDVITDHVDEQTYSEEINLVSPETGFFTWVAGLYYQHDRFHYPLTDTPGFVIDEPGILNLSFDGGQEAHETEAEFGQASFNLPDGFQLQAGLRHTYSANSKNIDVVYTFPGVGAFPFPQDQTERDSRVTGKVTLNWTINRDNFLYAFVATGHKSGGINVPTTSATADLIKPEDVVDYETGWKNEALDRHLRSQIDFYYYDYRDFQVTIGNPITPASSEILNIPAITALYGLEIQEQAVFGPLSLNVGGSYSHSSLGKFFAADSRTVVTSAGCNPGSGPVGGGCVGLTGAKQVYDPTFTFDAGAQYVFALPTGTLTPRLDFGHVGTEYATVFEDAAMGDKLGVRNILNAQVTYAVGTWLVTGYGTNLNNQHYVVGVSDGIHFAGAPRQYGVRLEKSF